MSAAVGEKHPRFVLGSDDDGDDIAIDEVNKNATGEAADYTCYGQARIHDEEPNANGVGAAAAAGSKDVQTQQTDAEQLKNVDEKSARAKKEASTSNSDYPPSPSSSPPSSESQRKPGRFQTFVSRYITHIPPQLAWLAPHLNWKGMRPVLRSSVAAWCGMLLMVNDRSQVFLGQASFLVLVVVAISPPSAPIATTLEMTFFQILLVASSWAWSCLAIAIAHAARIDYRYSQSDFNTLAAARYADANLSAAQLRTAILEEIFHGDYLEPQSSAVCAVFFATGCGFLLWLRGYLGPGPQLFGIILSVIAISIILTFAVLFPYPYYSVGLIFFLPFVFQEMINVTCAILIVPETLVHQFADRLVNTLRPLQTVIRQQRDMLHTDPRSLDWLKFRSLKSGTTSAMTALTLLGASEQNLLRELSYGRVSGPDLVVILANVRILVSRTTGFVQFHEVVELHLHRDAVDETDARGGKVAEALVVHMARSGAPSTGGDRTPDGDQDGSEASRDRDNHPDPDRLTEALSRAEEGRVTPHVSSPLARSQGTHSHPPVSQSAPAISRRASSSASLSDLDERESMAVFHRSHGARTAGQRSASRNRCRAAHHHSQHHPHVARHDRHHRNHHHHHKNGMSHASLPSLLHEVLHPHIDVRPVGAVESQRYTDLEDFLHNPRDEAHLGEIVGLLAKASCDLIHVLDDSVGHIMTTIHRLRATGTVYPFQRRDDSAYAAAVAKSEEQLRALEAAISDYRDVKRLEVLEPFKDLIDRHDLDREPDSDEMRAPSHRGLYWVLSYQWHLLSWSEALRNLFRETISIERKRRQPRFWAPHWAKVRLHRSRNDAEATFEDSNPDDLDALNHRSFTAARNPDFRPPRGRQQLVGIALYNFTHFFARKPFLSALKVAIVLGLVSMPAYFRSTAFFFYRNRGIWVISMTALTSTQFVGDTVYNFLVRVVGTTAGAVVGIALWYIAAQGTTCSPFAFAAVCAVSFPFLMTYRIYFMPPIEAILPVVTTMLILGYSWQNAHQPSLGSVGFGWDVAWRRFVCVCIGIAIAFLAAYLPPSVTQKGTIRRTYSKVTLQLGGVLCQILSFANCKRGVSQPPRQIIKDLATLRAKVAKTSIRKNMVRYEWSLRGPWPEEHYASLQSLLTELLDLLGQFLGVLASLDDKWTTALLHRTQLANPVFLGDVLVAFQLISQALEHGTPLPMIFNPLLERLLLSEDAKIAGRQYAYDLVLNEQIDGLPIRVTLETVKTLEYLRFSCGVFQCSAIANRIDRLMLVCKALTGEMYLLYGLEHARHRRQLPHDEADEERRWLHDETPRSSFDV